MNLQRKGQLVAVLLVVATFGACGGVVDPSENKVEMFSGTIQPLGTEGHQLRVGRNGEINVKITAMSNPDAIVELGYGMGSCANATLLNAAYRQLNQVGVGGLVSPGDHCVYIADRLATLRQATTYTLTVSYP
jgi:hypothetical protein